MANTRNWKEYLENIEDRTHETLINLSMATDDDTLVSNIDKLLKNNEFMMFFKDNILTSNITQSLSSEDRIASKEITDIILNHIVSDKASNETKELFMHMDISDAKFIHLQISRLIMVYSLKKFYQYKYKITV